MIKRLYIFIILLAFSSCLKEKYLDNEFVKHIVVEGHISQDDVARVMLTFNMVPSEDISEETLRDKIIKYMVVRVTEIVDGVAGTSEELVGSVDAKYPTHYLYQGAFILGKVGCKYRLDIEDSYSNQRWSATTIIPAPNELYNITAEKVDEKFYRLKATIKPNADNLPYMVRCATAFTKEARPHYYPLALFGLIECCDKETTITINRPLDYENIFQYSTLFLHEEDVYIQFCTMSKFGYDYWSVWENCTLNSLNPVFPVDEEPPTNITGDASGIWMGYGVSYYTIKPMIR